MSLNGLIYQLYLHLYGAFIARKIEPWLRDYC